MKDLLFGDKIKDPFIKTYISTFLLMHYPIPIFAIFGDTSPKGTSISRVAAIRSYIEETPSLFSWFPYSEEVWVWWALFAPPLLFVSIYYLVWAKWLKPKISNTLTRINMANLASDAKEQLTLNPYYTIFLVEELIKVLNLSVSNVNALNAAKNEVEFAYSQVSKPTQEFTNALAGLKSTAQAFAGNHQKISSFNHILKKNESYGKYSELVAGNEELHEQYKLLLKIVQEWEIKGKDTEPAQAL